MSTHTSLRQNPQALLPLIEEACRTIAPVWPLDSFVAVNPYLGLIDRPFSAVGSYLAETTGENLYMNRAWFAEKIAAGAITEAELTEAARQIKCDLTADAIKQAAWREPIPKKPLPLLALELNRRDAPPFLVFVIDQISGYLAAHYDRGQALWHMPAEAETSLYSSWRQYTLIDRSSGAAGLKGVRKNLLTVPDHSEDALSWALAKIDLPEEQLADYLFAALKSIGGWASYCRYLLWQAELQGEENHDLRDLMAIRLVWDTLILMEMDEPTRQRWRLNIAEWQRQRQSCAPEDAPIDEILLTAAEIAFRRRVASGLKSDHSDEPAMIPAVQAAFCIDVRSEVFRRHLEASMPNIETIGFAGFFGVPVDYSRLGEHSARTHTPVLLNPGYRAQQTGDRVIAERQHARLSRSASWKQFKLSAASCFTFVESAGLSYVPRLLADTLGWHRSSTPPDEAGLDAEERAQLHPALIGAHGGALNEQERINLAEGMLRGLGLTERFAPMVLLAGHGSSTTNNPYRAGLDCGACAGQTGEVSARVAAALLNEPAVRLGLVSKGIQVPRDTRFIAALHDTTTDQVSLLDVSTAGVSTTILTALEQAGELSRLERLVTLDTHIDRKAASRNVIHRGRDWSQVRPEWGLAGNAAFIAAPRWRTRGLDLGGRAFLHDYDWHKDDDFGVLTSIMTAPLVVANWINLQYYGSTVDNERLGSGNKVLHNVVGGLVGVLEGNGGDLRIGLSLQSLHDGETWRHEPLRLTAFIEAPTEVMDRVVHDHPMLRQLVDNRWLNLCQIDETGAVKRRFADGDWCAE
ncbi:MAG: YbcC family protein [Halothiobacillus sp.]